MIIVTGTKRSGTSMWMQILKKAGFSVLGRRFPRDWGETIRQANREGFYECSLRHGIHAATNPNPRTGAFLRPDESRRRVVKVFAQGLVKTDLDYVDYVIASVRDVRAYAASIARLYAMEHESKVRRAERAGRPRASVPRLTFAPAWLEWWNDNFSLIQDAALRGYPIRFVSYDAVLREPARLVGETLAWLGGGELGPALDAVKVHYRTQDGQLTQAEESGLDAAHEAAFHELHRRVAEVRGFDAAFRAELARVNAELAPRVRVAEQEARAARRRERLRARAERPS